MNIVLGKLMLNEKKYLKGKKVVYINKVYKIVEVLIAPDTTDPSFAMEYLLNRNAKKALRPYWGSQDLEIFLYCQRIGFRTPFFAKLSDVDILDD